MHVFQKINNIHPEGILLSSGIILQLDKSTREISLGLIILWVGACLIQGIQKNRDSIKTKNLSTAYAIALGILLFQTRTIMKGVNEDGISQYLLIAAGIIASSTLNKKQWKTLLMWLSIASIGISSLLLIHYSSEANWLDIAYRELFRDGIGGNINKLGLALTYLTISSWACLRVANQSLGRLFGLAGLVLGYTCCIFTGSRMAIVSPLMGVCLGWSLSHMEWIKKLRIKDRVIVACGLASTIFSASWILVIRPEIDSSTGLWSDIGRINLFKCWIGSLFTGHNRLIYGTGHSTSFIRTYCTSDKIFPWGDPSPASSFDYAHNTFAQVLGLYGLLGLSALIIIGSIYIRAVILNYKEERKLLYTSLRTPSWTEITLATMISMLICAFAESSYHGDPVLQILSGIILAFPLNQVSSSE